MSATRATADLRPHPDNTNIFGPPEDCEQYEALTTSIRAVGIIEPLTIKSDGTIISGHLRHSVACKLKLRTVPVRVIDTPATYRDELELLIRSNTDRRQLTKGQVALAFKVLRETPREQGGAAGKRGGDRKSVDAKNQSAASGTLKPKARDEAAALLGVGRHEAEALEIVFATPGVPEELKRAVNSGVVAATPAAKAVRAEVKRQGGTIKETTALRAVADPPRPQPRVKPAHEQRVADEADRYMKDYRELFELYKRLDSILTRRPLKTVLGPTEHHEYAGMIRDVSMRALREIESVQGPNKTGRQVLLAVVPGGRA